MWHRYIAAGAIGAALFGLAYAPPAAAANMETEAVWGNLRPNLTPPFSKKQPAKTTRYQKQRDAKSAWKERRGRSSYR